MAHTDGKFPCTSYTLYSSAHAIQVLGVISAAIFGTSIILLVITRIENNQPLRR